ncbi:MAG TPA: electron transfer flavoprotein subunit alpha [bacterium]|nr:electron transfer flavoprotein subunit alpha [bacterium]
METILFLSSTESDGRLSRASLEAAAAAAALAQSLGNARLTAGLFGAQAGPAAAQLAGAGFDKALLAESPALASGRYATDLAAAQALALASRASLVLAPSSSRVQRVAAGLAQRLGGVLDTHATELLAEDGAVALRRWYYRQRLLAKQSRAKRPWVITVEAGTAPALAAIGSLATETVAFQAPAGRSRVTGLRSPSSGPQTIRPDAALLLVAGAGWCKKQADGALHVADAERLILGFLDKTQASLGGSKSVVDQTGDGASLSFMSHVNQVGQTGSTPRHAKGLSTCCHGEEPHVVGWRFVNERRAVNLNAGCGWAQGKADVLYVADAFQVMDELNKLL